MNAMVEKLSPRQAEVVELYTEKGLTVPEIAAQLSCGEANIYKILARDDVRQTIVQLVRNRIALSSVQAAKTLNRLSSSAKSEFVQLEASKALLDRAGITQPVETSGVLQINIKV